MKKPTQPRNRQIGKHLFQYVSSHRTKEKAKKEKKKYQDQGYTTRIIPIPETLQGKFGKHGVYVGPKRK